MQEVPCIHDKERSLVLVGLADSGQLFRLSCCLFKRDSSLALGSTLPVFAVQEVFCQEFLAWWKDRSTLHFGRLLDALKRSGRVLFHTLPGRFLARCDSRDLLLTQVVGFAQS